jgi:hypothetical protein
VVNSCEHGAKPLGSMKGGEFLISWETIGFSRKTLFHGDSFMYVLCMCMY